MLTLFKLILILSAFFGPETKEADLLCIELARTSKAAGGQVVRHTGFALSYNESWRIPNWVAWELTAEKAKGTVARPQRQFEPDPQIRGRQAEHRDYSRSGYSRGHMAPAGDMKWSERAMNESFYTSNICPQLEELNNGKWKNLEEHTRWLAKEGTVYICCGPIVAAHPQRIGENRVAVPEQFFKVLCMKRRGRWQAIGFVFRNEKCTGGLDRYALSVDEVEELTGHDFFYNLPDSIEDEIEAKCNWKGWQ